MNPFTRTLSAFSALFNRHSKIENQKSFDPSAWLRGEDAPDTTPVLTNAYQQVVWVYRAINVLAEQVANIPFLFSTGERGRENLITSGPLLDLYNRPHPHINRFQYWELRVIWLMLRGECVRIPIFDSPHHSHSALRTPQSELASGVRGASYSPQSKFKNQNSKIRKILILDPAQFQHIVQDHELLGWRYTGFSRDTPLENQVFLPEEVWFEKLPNPFDFWRGLPPLYVANLAAQTDYAAASFMRGLMENNADLGAIVRVQGQLDPTQREQLLAALKNRKRRAGTADAPLLLWSGAEVIKPTLSSADLQFLENRKFSRAEICAAFGVPEEIVTITDNSKYDVMNGSRLNFIENRVAPLCARLEAEEERTVKLIDPDAIGWFDLDSLPIMQQARRNRLAAAKTGFDMGIPFNELNQVFDLGFKPLPWGNQGHLPANLQTIGELPPTSRSALHAPPSTPSVPDLPAALHSMLEILRKPGAPASPPPRGGTLPA
ncbi:MAG TPA: phage portal protein [Tepidisphaeraceae bacterium]|nr:phage portal protein [Tepidisphaeraceae bacterium]